MEEILHLLIGSFSNYLQYKVLYIPIGAGFVPSTVLKGESNGGSPDDRGIRESYELIMNFNLMAVAIYWRNAMCSMPFKTI